MSLTSVKVEEFTSRSTVSQVDALLAQQFLPLPPARGDDFGR